jgi:hypothetical protein
MNDTVTNRRKRGDAHPSGDGRVFYVYRSAKKGGGEEWITSDLLHIRRQKAREGAARKYAENPEAAREKSRIWSKANPEKVKAMGAKCSAKRAGTQKARDYRAAYYLKNRDRIMFLNRKWKSENADLYKEISARCRLKDPDKQKEQGRRWYLQNQEKSKERASAWGKANPERRLELVRKWRLENLDQFNKTAARWRSENPDKRKAIDHRRRAAKIGALHPSHSVGMELSLAQSANRLRDCLGAAFHIDHIVPLTRGGFHYHLNLRVLPASINLSKNNKLDSELKGIRKTQIEAWTPSLN